MREPCLCGDLYCHVCGPLQGNFKCPVCGNWSGDGGCDNPELCRATQKKWDDELAAQYEEEKRLARGAGYV